jgi:hypothetical protein
MSRFKHHHFGAQLTVKPGEILAASFLPAPAFANPASSGKILFRPAAGSHGVELHKALVSDNGECELAVWDMKGFRLASSAIEEVVIASLRARLHLLGEVMRGAGMINFEYDSEEYEALPRRSIVFRFAGGTVHAAALIPAFFRDHHISRTASAYCRSFNDCWETIPGIEAGEMISQFTAPAHTNHTC